MHDDIKQPVDEPKRRESWSIETVGVLLLLIGLLWGGLFICAALLAFGEALRRQPKTAKLGLWTMLLAVAFALAFAGYHVGGDLAKRDNGRDASSASP